MNQKVIDWVVPIGFSIAVIYVAFVLDDIMDFFNKKKFKKIGAIECSCTSEIKHCVRIVSVPKVLCPRCIKRESDNGKLVEII